MTDVNQLITEHLDIWTSATEKKSSAGRGNGGAINLYGIKKLRELILELAVRGKLVPQDDSDESGGELLGRIKSIQRHLYKSKNIKKPKDIPDPSYDELDYDVPSGWALARLNDLGDWGAGATPSRKSSGLYGGDIPWFKSGELTADLISTSEETVTAEALKKSSLRLNKPGDVLVAMYGATIGKTAILDVEGTTNQAVCACTPFDGFYNRYLLLLLKAYKSRLVGMGAGGAQPNISREKIIATVVALPPTVEQHRIVAKVDELMGLCDALEAQAEESLKAHQTLVETCLATLTNSQTPEEVSQSWPRIETNFDTLFTTEESIAALKRILLSFAIRGMLVAQNDEDEPAQEAIEACRSRIRKLVREKQIRKPKTLPEISDAQAVKHLPDGWARTRFGELITMISGQHLKPSEYSQSGTYPYLTGPAEFGPKHPECTRFTDEQRAIAASGDILVTCKGSGIGKTNLADQKIAISRQLMAVRAIGLDPEFAMLFVDDLKDDLRSKMVGIAIPGISREDILEAKIELPPIQEQRRIVAKMKDLSALCEALLSKIPSKNSVARQLADTLNSKIH